MRKDKIKKIIQYFTVIVISFLFISIGMALAKNIVISNGLDDDVAYFNNRISLGRSYISGQNVNNPVLEIHPGSVGKTVSIDANSGAIVTNYVPNNDEDVVNKSYLDSSGIGGDISEDRISSGVFGKKSSSPDGTYNFPSLLFINHEKSICNPDSKLVVGGPVEVDSIRFVPHVSGNICSFGVVSTINSSGAIDFNSDSSDAIYNFNEKINALGYQFNGNDGLTHDYEDNDILTGVNIGGGLILSADSVNGFSTTINTQGTQSGPCQMQFVAGILVSTDCR